MADPEDSASCYPHRWKAGQVPRRTEGPSVARVMMLQHDALVPAREQCPSDERERAARLLEARTREILPIGVMVREKGPSGMERDA